MPLPIIVVEGAYIVGRAVARYGARYAKYESRVITGNFPRNTPGWVKKGWRASYFASTAIGSSAGGLVNRDGGAYLSGSPLNTTSEFGEKGNNLVKPKSRRKFNNRNKSNKGCRPFRRKPRYRG